MKQRPNKDFFRSPVSSVLDKLLFAFAFLGGSFAIIVLRLIGTNVVLVSTVAVAIMLAYLALTWASAKFRIREDQIGDNLYYLGFLYTLVSLGYALWDLNRSEGQNAIDEVVSNFGIALVSTVCGVFLRVLIHQLRSDPVEIEREARVELLEASNSLRAELSAVVLDVNDFRRHMLQTVREVIEDTHVETAKAMTQSAGTFSESVQSILGQIDGSFSTYNDSATRMNGVANQVANSMEQLVERLEKIEAPDDIIVSKLLPALEDIEQVTASIKQQSTEEYASAQALASVAEGLKGITNQLNTRMTDAEKQTASLKEVSGSFDRLAHALGTSATSQREQGKLMVQKLEELSNALSGNNKMITKTAETMGEISEAIKDLKNTVENPPQELDAPADTSLDQHPPMEDVRADGETAIGMFSRALRTRK